MVNCSHKKTEDFSGKNHINIICVDCKSHLYESETTKKQWINSKDWFDWINSSDDFDGLGFDYFKKHLTK